MCPMCPLTSCTRCTLFQLECGGFLCLNILGPTSIGFFPKKQIISNNSTFVRAKTSNHWEFLPKQHQVGSWGFSSWAFSLPPKRKQPPPIFFLVPTVDGEIFPSKQCPEELTRIGFVLREAPRSVHWPHLHLVSFSAINDLVSKVWGRGSEIR